jgi:hypothetical protein
MFGGESQNSHARQDDYCPVVRARRGSDFGENGRLGAGAEQLPAPSICSDSTHHLARPPKFSIGTRDRLQWCLATLLHRPRATIARYNARKPAQIERRWKARGDSQLTAGT